MPGRVTTMCPRLNQMQQAYSTFDYVIVGGGPAGCVVASRLSENPPTRVLLVEAGSAASSRLLRLLARVTNWSGPRRRWDEYETEPQSGLNGRQISLRQARILGGGSAINAMTYVRGHAGDYDHWERLGNDGWGWDVVLPAFKRLENNTAIMDGFHGCGGALSVSDQLQLHLLTRAFIDAGHAVGLTANRDFNGAMQEGIGPYQVTQRRGRRCSAADAFVQPFLHRPNLTVLTDAYVTRIVIHRRRAIGVEFITAGRVHEAYAVAEVIVSSGAINSPKLLLLSGIGPAEDLRRLGIPVMHDLPGVGRNLHDHPSVPVLTQCRRPITYDHWDRPIRLLKYGLQFVLFNAGLAVSNICEGGAFLRSDLRSACPDTQLHFMPLLWLDQGRIPVEGYGMTIEAAFLQPASRGTVTLASSSNPFVPPRIDPRYCTTGNDIEILVEAVRRCREIIQAPALRPFVAREISPGPDVQSDAELANYVRDQCIPSHHLVGTCKMGTDALAVVDPDLRVRGLDALRVIDSSIMPRVTSGSTQAPSMMIGEIGARRILGARTPAQTPPSNITAMPQRAGREDSQMDPI